MKPHLTFEEFKQTRSFCSKLSALDIGLDTDNAGLVYCNGLGIEILPTGEFYLLINRSDWASYNLEKLERLLYEYARGEFFAAKPDTRDDLTNEWQHFCHVNTIADSEGVEMDADAVLALYEDRAALIPKIKAFIDRWDACDWIVPKYELITLDTHPHPTAIHDIVAMDSLSNEYVCSVEHSPNGFKFDWTMDNDGNTNERRRAIEPFIVQSIRANQPTK